MKKVIFLAIVVLAGCKTVQPIYMTANTEHEIIATMYETVHALYYEKMLDPNAGNFYEGENELSAQCGDYALYFVLKWNREHTDSIAYLCLASQPKHFPNGLYSPVYIGENDVTVAYNTLGYGFSRAPNHTFFSTLGTYELVRASDEVYKLWPGQGSTTHVWVVIKANSWIGIVDSTVFDNGGELNQMYAIRGY